MRIGSYELKNIRNRITDDLYRKAEEKLTERKVGIAKKAREYYIEPFMSTMSTLPIELIAHDKEYAVRIKYTAPNSQGGDAPDIDENWTYRADDPLINPKNPKQGGPNYYSNVPENILDERLRDEVDLLCKDILKLKAKKEEMTTYLIETTTKYTGSLQLRKAWEKSPHLLKYLPMEPVKTPKTKIVRNKKVIIEDPTIPEGLNEQLTENLLEGA